MNSHYQIYSASSLSQKKTRMSDWTEVKNKRWARKEQSKKVEKKEEKVQPQPPAAKDAFRQFLAAKEAEKKNKAVEQQALKEKQKLQKEAEEKKVEEEKKSQKEAEEKNKAEEENKLEKRYEAEDDARHWQQLSKLQEQVDSVAEKLSIGNVYRLVKYLSKLDGLQRCGGGYFPIRSYRVASHFRVSEMEAQAMLESAVDENLLSRHDDEYEDLRGRRTFQYYPSGVDCW